MIAWALHVLFPFIFVRFVRCLGYPPLTGSRLYTVGFSSNRNQSEATSLWKTILLGGRDKLNRRGLDECCLQPRQAAAMSSNSRIVSLLNPSGRVIRTIRSRRCRCR